MVRISQGMACSAGASPAAKAPSQPAAGEAPALLVSIFYLMFLEIVAENFIHARLPRRDRAHNSRHVHEVAIVEILRKAVAAPRPAAHRKREWQAVVEAAAVRDRV